MTKLVIAYCADYNGHKAMFCMQENDTSLQSEDYARIDSVASIAKGTHTGPNGQRGKLLTSSNGQLWLRYEDWSVQMIANEKQLTAQGEQPSNTLSDHQLNMIEQSVLNDEYSCDVELVANIIANGVPFEMAIKAPQLRAEARLDPLAKVVLLDGELVIGKIERPLK